MPETDPTRERSLLARWIAKLFRFRLAIIAETMTLFLLLIIISQTLFLDHIEDVILTIVVFSLASLIGAFLVYSVRAQEAQRYESQKLAEYLRSANKQLLQLDRLKSEFIYLATHQIRTPLTAIRGYLSMILEGDFGRVPDGLEQPINTAFVSSKEMVDTIEYFLSVTRMERGELDYDMEAFDMRSLVSSTVNQMKPIIDRSGLTLHIDIDEHNDYTVYGDADKLRQVISNIIDNAIQYTRSGSISVHLWKYDGFVRLEVRDTGVGMNKDDQAQIFKKFGRADGAEKNNVFGAGLGLYIAYRIINDHNGRIYAKSDGRGKGSTFVVELHHGAQGAPHKPDTKNINRINAVHKPDIAKKIAAQTAPHPRH
ncbi:MAG: HAMP domain-containing sensor histidine kinase [Candidatus Paceibacterota bacterium]